MTGRTVPVAIVAAELRHLGSSIISALEVDPDRQEQYLLGCAVMAVELAEDLESGEA